MNFCFFTSWMPAAIRPSPNNITGYPSPEVSAKARTYPPAPAAPADDPSPSPFPFPSPSSSPGGGGGGGGPPSPSPSPGGKQHPQVIPPTFIGPFSIKKSKKMSPVFIVTSPPVFPFASFFPVFKSQDTSFVISALLFTLRFAKSFRRRVIKFVEPDPFSLTLTETSWPPEPPVTL